ncbi:type III-B CRISPR module RAMP protein Cmr6 [Candidatus Symbiobacter mobilis]|uniref:type III-B CRISPR module RAMP protein Cmr6 n=1 Tax=Candidatus Symbiobacter mobilis TaxID=1436290 RepID=UPI001651004D|nr:type III-B CRISPR module RAMP protein Cmr6 [Candidatus Symbiobacter mobilis]
MIYQNDVCNPKEKKHFLEKSCPLPPSSVKTVEALIQRQTALVATYGANGLHWHTTSTAPFATGLGNEHPIENGFAFLTPYGLPYLAGSGFKGILRRAAEELALDNDTQNDDGWTWVDIWWLFGFEGAVNKGSQWDSDSDLGHAFERDSYKLAANANLHELLQRLANIDKSMARYADSSDRTAAAQGFLQACLAGSTLRGGLQWRGAVDCWDVYPQPQGNRMVVEIMTPHHGPYYRGDSNPHDSHSPIPVNFLAVPAGSAFHFFAVCHAQKLPQGLQNRWRALLDAAMHHACEWVGFGAKTSVGYGAMQKPAPLPQPAPAKEPRAATTSTEQPIAPVEEGIIWQEATLTYSRNTSEITAGNPPKKTKPLKGDLAKAFLNALPEKQRTRLTKDGAFRNVPVVVKQDGNTWELLRPATTG